MVTLTLYSRPGCCLCDQLEEEVRAELEKRASASDIALRKRNIDQDPAAHKQYTDRIPVLLLGDDILLEGRPDPQKVSAAITQALKAAAPT